MTPTLKLVVPLKNRFLIEIETALDGTVFIRVVQTKPLRTVDSVMLRGEQLNRLHNIICSAWESA